MDCDLDPDETKMRGHHRELRWFRYDSGIRADSAFQQHSSSDALELFINHRGDDDLTVEAVSCI